MDFIVQERIVAMATKDIKIQNRCDHRLRFEEIALESDYISLRPSCPISSRTSVVLYRFGLEVNSEMYYFVKEDSILYSNSNYYYIKLKEPDLYELPVYEVTFSTYEQYCPICMGTNYADDFIESPSNFPKTVSGPYQLIQNVEKLITTTLKSNPYHSWIGCGIKGIVGTKVPDQEAISSSIESSIRTALGNLKSIQIKNQGSNTKVSPDEVFGDVEKIDMTFDEEDPTYVEVFVQYHSQSGSSYDYTQLLELTNLRAH